MKKHILTIVLIIIIIFGINISESVSAKDEVDEIKTPIFLDLEAVSSSVVKISFKSNNICSDCGIEILNVNTGEIYRVDNGYSYYNVYGLAKDTTYTFKIRAYYIIDNITYNTLWTSSKSITTRLMPVQIKFSGKIYKYYQYDYKQSYCNAIIANSGCGPTSMAIAASSILQREITPLVMAEYGCNIRKYSPRGVGHTFFDEVLKSYGLEGKWVSKEESNEILKALSSGNSIVIAHMGKGHFTNFGHYITLVGVYGAEVLVQDPGSFSNSKYWDFSTILNESVDYHKEQFLIISK